MKVSRCENGHFYDTDIYEVCPYCTDKNSQNKPFYAEKIKSNKDLGIKLTQHYIEKKDAQKNAEEKTVSLISKLQNREYVTGWIVCENGCSKGKSFEIYAGRNFVCLTDNGSILVLNDDGFSDNSYFEIIFDPNSTEFYVFPHENFITKFNDNILFNEINITEGDIITIGESTLRMIPYCKEGRAWK